MFLRSRTRKLRSIALDAQVYRIAKEEVAEMWKFETGGCFQVSLFPFSLFSFVRGWWPWWVSRVA